MKREGRRIENTWRITCISRSWILRNLQSDGINNDKWIDYFEFSLHSHWCEECHPLELAVSITNVLMCPPESLHSWTEQIANGLLACLLDSHNKRVSVDLKWKILNTRLGIEEGINRNDKDSLKRRANGLISTRCTIPMYRCHGLWETNSPMFIPPSSCDTASVC